MFTVLLALVSIAAAAVAAISGFGIGSLLTPAFAVAVGTKTAIAAVSIPHFVGTVVRFWRMRADVDRQLLWRFGLPSAAGGLAGALLNAQATSPALATVFGLLLVVAGVSQLTGASSRWRIAGPLGSVAGIVSGFFGGLVGNQGGIRAAAMLGFEVTRDRFVATATAVALLVDLVRLPIYLLAQGDAVALIWPFVAMTTVGVVVGTVAGGAMLKRIPEPVFRRAVGLLILVLGLAVLVRGRA